MSNIKKLKQLKQLTEMVLIAEQAKLARLNAREADLKRGLHDMSSARADRLRTLATGPDIASMSGADLRWEAWITARQADTNMQLARIRVAKEKPMRDMARAFGRDQAATKLEERAREDQAAAARRRADYMS